jgi:hypothetical protein
MVNEKSAEQLNSIEVNITGYVFFIVMLLKLNTINFINLINKIKGFLWIFFER